MTAHTATRAAVTHTTSTEEHRRPLWRTGLTVSAVAAVVVTVLTVAAMAAGVSFADPTGTRIPLLGFTQLTFVFSMAGVGIAALLRRRARRPRATFVRTTVALTLLSFVPDLVSGFDSATTVSLMTLHVVAAVVVVPVLARELPAGR